MKTRKATKKSALLKALFIDPYRQELQRIEIENDLDTWRKALRCDWIEHLTLSRESVGHTNLDLWFNEEGAINAEPALLAPRFRLQRGNSAGGGLFAIHGYGLVTSSNAEGETVSLITNPLSAATFGAVTYLAFEDPQSPEPGNRLRGKEFLEEKLRLIDLELPGKFRYLASDE